MITKASVLPRTDLQTNQTVQQAHDEPTMRNARQKLDYKKSFNDDLLFFPELQVSKRETHADYSNAYMSPSGMNTMLNPSYNSMASLHGQHPQVHQHPHQFKDNLTSLLALKNLEKQKQQLYTQGHVPSHTYSFENGGQTYYSDSARLPQQYGEQYQNYSNYANTKNRM